MMVVEINSVDIDMSYSNNDMAEFQNNYLGKRCIGKIGGNPFRTGEFNKLVEIEPTEITSNGKFVKVRINGCLPTWLNYYGTNKGGLHTIFGDHVWLHNHFGLFHIIEEIK